MNLNMFDSSVGTYKTTSLSLAASAILFSFEILIELIPKSISV